MVSPSLTLLRTQSDERLIALARAGHERAFEAIVERYRKPLLRHGRRLLSSEARAEEAVQQAFMAAWAALQRGDDVRHLSGWLHRIVHNAALNSLRGERDDWSELREWLEGAGAPDDEVERREMLRVTLTNLAALPARQREALLRIAVEGESAEDVGSSLGLSEGAVRQLLYRARTALRAAATAVTPWPIASWLARAEPVTAGVADLAGGAGSAGIGALLAKAGVVAVVAGGAVAGPVVLDDDPPRTENRSPVAEETQRSTRPAPAATAPITAAREIAPAGVSDSSGSRSGSSDDNSGSGSSRSGSGDSDNSGSDSSGSGDSDNSGSSSGSSGSGSSGSGSDDADDSDNSGSGSSGSGSGGSGTSGSGSSGSGSSGSGSSGSGSSGSGSSGSGLSGSGSDSSGSGSSGSGSSGSGSDDGDDFDSSGSGSSGSGSSGSGSG
jgi:RNA polymerase sigma factor (sigma-70 family)